MDTKSLSCSSPEFEFWMLRNPSFPQQNIISADELFVDGVILPLHLLSTQNKPDPETPAPLPDPDPQPESSPAITDSPSTTASKRWKDIFRKSDKKNAEEKKKERKVGSAGRASASAELNINIWPFSRSRSAGNSGTRPKSFAGAPVFRKVNSAPCSRSNSAGESKSRKLPSSPGRVGVHLGRSSPVWQVRRGGKNAEQSLASRPSKGGGGGGSKEKEKVLNLNVPMCIGYREQQLSCRSDDDNSSAIGVSNGGVKLFNLRSFFTKKNLVTSH